MKYRGIKMSTIKGFAEGYLGHKLTNSEFENMFRRWDSINRVGQYFTSLGDFLRDYKMEK